MFFACFMLVACFPARATTDLISLFGPGFSYVVSSSDWSVLSFYVFLLNYNCC